MPTGYCGTPHSQGGPRFPCRIQGCRPSRCLRGGYGPPPSSLSRSQELGLGVSFRAGEPLSAVGAMGPQGLLTSSGQFLTAKCCRSLAEPSVPEVASAPIPRSSEHHREAPESYEREGNLSSEPLRSFLNCVTAPSYGNSRSLPSAGVTGGAALSGEGRGAEQGACAGESLSGRIRDLPSGAG